MVNLRPYCHTIVTIVVTMTAFASQEYGYKSNSNQQLEDELNQLQEGFGQRAAVDECSHMFGATPTMFYMPANRTHPSQRARGANAVTPASLPNQHNRTFFNTPQFDLPPTSPTASLAVEPESPTAHLKGAGWPIAGYYRYWSFLAKPYDNL